MEIKAIQCPKCGSTQKTEIRPNRFRCASCGTEYVLDTGNQADVTRTIIAPPEQPKTRSYIIIGAIAFLFVLLAVFLSQTTGTGKGSYHATARSPDNYGLPVYRWEWRESFLYSTPDNKPVLLSIGNRHDQSSQSSGDAVTYAVFADAGTGRKITSVKLAGFSSETMVRFREFSSGEIYMITDNTSIYRVDKGNYTVTDVTRTLFDKQPELVDGITSVEFLPFEEEDGLKLVTNDGKTLNYFPLVHKVYGNDQLWAAEKGFGNLLPGAVEKTGFTFCYFFTYDHDESVQRQQLIRYRYMDNVGGPKTSAGVLPKGVNDQNQKGPRVISYTDITPGRFYFSQKMLYYDSNVVLIAFKPTAAVNANPPDVQCLDAHTAKILFTVKLPDATNMGTSIRTTGGFSILNYNSVYNIGPDGKINHFTQPKDYEF